MGHPVQVVNRPNPPLDGDGGWWSKKMEGEQAMAALCTWLLVHSNRYVDVVGTLRTNVEVFLSVSVTFLKMLKD